MVSASQPNPSKNTRRVVVRRGHWRRRPGGIYKTIRVRPVYEYVPRKKSVEKAAAAETWLPVERYQDQLRRRFDPTEIEPIYRFDPHEDVIGSADGFVWDAPLDPRPGGGYEFPKKVIAFRGLRIWLKVVTGGDDAEDEDKDAEDEDKDAEDEDKDAEDGDTETKIHSYNILASVDTWGQLVAARNDFAYRIAEDLMKRYKTKNVRLVAWTAYVKIGERGTGDIPSRPQKGPGKPGWEIMLRPDLKRTYKKRKKGRRRK